MIKFGVHAANLLQGVNMKEESGYENHYEHCGQIWIDTWSCMCNDRCPVCNKEIEPYFSRDMTEDTEEIGTATILNFTPRHTNRPKSP